MNVVPDGERLIDDAGLERRLSAVSIVLIAAIFLLAGMGMGLAAWTWLAPAGSAPIGPAADEVPSVAPAYTE